MYRVHLDCGANQGEIPGIGESPSNQPISGLVIFSKRQALSEQSSSLIAMNHDKTVSMIICPAFSKAISVSSGGSAQPVIEYNGHCVTHVNNSRLLGVIVDDKLSWNDIVDADWFKACPKNWCPQENFWTTHSICKTICTLFL